MVDRGVVPSLEVVEWTADWDEAERRWISKCLADGCDLVNGNGGGLDMRQARVPASYPHIKRFYRDLETELRMANRRGSAATVSLLASALETYRAKVARARKHNPAHLAVIDRHLAARYGRS
jgi:hypothetical protein